MALSTTIKDRVLSQLGEDNSDYLDQISAPEELFNEALWEIAGIVPPRYLLTQVSEPADPEELATSESNPQNIQDKLVLLVTRTEAEHTLNGETGGLITEQYITKPCKKVAFEDSHKSRDVDSIYFATKYSPVYTVKNIGGNKNIFVYPEPSPAFTAGNGPYGDDTILPKGNSAMTVYAYTRQHIMESGGQTITDKAWNLLTDFVGMPRDVEDIIIKRIALKVIELKLSDMATQEEDTELFTLLGQNKALIEEALKNGLDKLRSEWD